MVLAFYSFKKVYTTLILDGGRESREKRVADHTTYLCYSALAESSSGRFEDITRQMFQRNLNVDQYPIWIDIANLERKSNCVR